MLLYPAPDNRECT